jgi:hypothetical protein
MALPYPQVSNYENGADYPAIVVYYDSSFPKRGCALRRRSYNSKGTDIQHYA